MRSGIIAKKMGMTRLFNEDGKQIPVTVLLMAGLQVVGQRTKAKDGYDAVTLGLGDAKLSRLSQAQRGHYAKHSLSPKRKIAEFRVSEEALLPLGGEILADHFLPGQKVDVSGESIGKGFAGSMKRHNFGGLRASHGVSISHRSHGSTGHSQEPGRVFKGKKMAGHMGTRNVTVHNLKVIHTDSNRGVIFIRGAVPGAKGGWVFVRDAVKAEAPENLPFPASLKQIATSEHSASIESIEMLEQVEQDNLSTFESSDKGGQS